MKRFLASMLCVFILFTAAACNENSSDDLVKIEITTPTVEYDGMVHYPSIEITPNDAGDIDFRIFKDGELVSEAKAVGEYSIEVTVTGENLENVVSKTVAFEIIPKALNLDGVTFVDKEYDGTTAYDKIQRIREGVISGETVNGTVKGTLSTKNVTESCGLTVESITLSGKDAGNYTVGSYSDAKAGISKKQVTIGGITVTEKDYDGTATATYTGTPTVVGAVEGEDVFVTINSIAFPSSDSGKDVKMVVEATLGGKHANNYELAEEHGVIGTIKVDTGMFEFDTSTGTITKYNGTASSVDIPSEISGVTVKAIGERAFYYENGDDIGRPNMTKVYFPSTLEVIGKEAFLYTGITGVNIPASVTTIADGAFQYCNSLVTVNFAPGSLCNSIGQWAFSYTALTSLNLPEGITVLPFASFAYCTGTLDFVVPKSVSLLDESSLFLSAFTSVTFAPRTANDPEISFGKYAFAGVKFESFEIPSFCTYIGVACFQNATNLKTLTFAERTKDLTWGEDTASEADFIFNGTSISMVNIPGAIKSLGRGLFIYVTSLKTVTLNEGTERIEAFAFQGAGITSINLPATLKYIGFAAFNECKDLAILTYSDGTEAAEIVFDEWAFARTSIVKLTLDSRVVKVNYAVFAFCDLIETLTIENEGNTLTFGMDVFFGCTKLASVTLPKRVNPDLPINNANVPPSNVFPDTTTITWES